MKNTMLFLGSMMTASNAATLLTNAILAGPSVPAPNSASNFSYGETGIAFTDTDTGGTGTFDYTITVTYYNDSGVESNYDNWTTISVTDNGTQLTRLVSPDEGYFNFSLSVSNVTNDFTGLAASVTNVGIDSYLNEFSNGVNDRVNSIDGGTPGITSTDAAWGSDVGNNRIQLSGNNTNFLVRENPGAADAETGNDQASNLQTIDDLIFTGDFFAAVPEPSSAALLGLGGLALVARRRR